MSVIAAAEAQAKIKSDLDAAADAAARKKRKADKVSAKDRYVNIAHSLSPHIYRCIVNARTFVPIYPLVLNVSVALCAALKPNG